MRMRILMNRKSVTRTITGGLAMFVALGFGGLARAADSWTSLFPSVCAMPMNGPQMFAYTANPSGTYGIESIWTTNNGASWAKQTIAPDTNLRGTPLACAGDGFNQGFVIYRDSNSNLKSRDRLSGWQETSLPGGGFAVGAGVTVINVADQSGATFVAFAVKDNDTITMSTWNNSTNPKWSTAVSLAAVPGHISRNNANDLAAYSVGIGQSAGQALVSLFVVNNSGHLMENKGLLTGTRTWTDWGAPSGRSFSNFSVESRPAATAVYDSPFGHPGTYSETEYYRRVTLPTADQQAIYSLYAAPGATSPSWVQISTSQVPIAFQLSSGSVRGCSQPGEPCAGAIEITGTTLTGHTGFVSWYSGATDGTNNPPAGWTVLPQTTTTEVPSAVVYPGYSFQGESGNIHGVMFYENTTTDMAVVNLDTLSKTDFGAP